MKKINKEKKCKNKVIMKTLKLNNPSKLWLDNNFSRKVYLYPHSMMPPCISHKPSIVIEISITSTVVSVQSLSLFQKPLTSSTVSIRIISAKNAWWHIFISEHSITLNYNALMKIVSKLLLPPQKKLRNYRSFF